MPPQQALNQLKQCKIPQASTICTTSNLLYISIIVRLVFFLYGLHQDRTSLIPYTDIDYYVFSDAAKYVAQGNPPYLRDTYRYTPILSWLLVGNEILCEHFGKLLFMLCDLVTGWIIIKTLKIMKVRENNAVRLAAVWLLNPMVITISTRGSSESLLTAIVMGFIYHLIRDEYILAGLIAGLGVHFKIYPVIYLTTALLYLSSYDSVSQLLRSPLILFGQKQIVFLIATLTSFFSLTYTMYHIYGFEFLEHTYLYHLRRLDHRHNFSVYNISLYFTSAFKSTNTTPCFTILNFDFTKLAFFPQLALSAILIPLVYTKRSLMHTLFLQTLAFVTFNKVMTSQYFIWFLIFLPLVLSRSSLLSTRKTGGIFALAAWVAGQGWWLYNAYRLEFLGEVTFYPGLCFASAGFFVSNLIVMSVFIDSCDDMLVQDFL